MGKPTSSRLSFNKLPTMSGLDTAAMPTFALCLGGSMPNGGDPMLSKQFVWPRVNLNW
jgi:hypothetical protein